MGLLSFQPCVGRDRNKDSAPVLVLQSVVQFLGRNAHRTEAVW